MLEFNIRGVSKVHICVQNLELTWPMASMSGHGKDEWGAEDSKSGVDLDSKGNDKQGFGSSVNIP